MHFWVVKPVPETESLQAAAEKGDSTRIAEIIQSEGNVTIERVTSRLRLRVTRRRRRKVPHSIG